MTLKEYRESNRDLSEADLKRLWRREYMRAYRTKKKSARKARIELVCDGNIKKRLTAEAKKHSSSLNAFMLASSLAYIDQGYIPHDKDLAQELTKDLQRISSNINQVVRNVHSMTIRNMDGSASIPVGKLRKYEQALSVLIDLVRQSKELVYHYVAKPPPQLLGKISWEEMKAQPERIVKLIAYLQNYLKTAE